MLSLVHERYGAGSVIDAVATLTPDGSGESRLTHRGETGVAPELVIANECLHRKGGTTLSGHNFVECDPASTLIYHVSGGRYYDDTSKRVRLFCTECEGQAAKLYRSMQ